MEANEHAEKRVSDLESWAKGTEQRMDEIGRRMDKQDANLQRIWERLDEHRDGQIKTQTLVEVGNRDTAELKTAFQAFREVQEHRRAQEDMAAKARRPSWIQVIITGGSLLVAVISLIAVIMRG